MQERLRMTKAARTAGGCASPALCLSHGEVDARVEVELSPIGEVVSENPVKAALQGNSVELALRATERWLTTECSDDISYCT